MAMAMAMVRPMLMAMVRLIPMVIYNLVIASRH